MGIVRKASKAVTRDEGFGKIQDFFQRKKTGIAPKARKAVTGVNKVKGSGTTPKFMEKKKKRTIVPKASTPTSASAPHTPTSASQLTEETSVSIPSLILDPVNTKQLREFKDTYTPPTPEVVKAFQQAFPEVVKALQQVFLPKQLNEAEIATIMCIATDMVQREKNLDAQHGSKTEKKDQWSDCLLYTSPSPRDLSTSRMPSSA